MSFGILARGLTGLLGRVGGVSRLLGMGGGAAKSLLTNAGTISGAIDLGKHVAPLIQQSAMPHLRNVGQTISKWVGGDSFRQKFNKVGDFIDNRIPGKLKMFVPEGVSVGDVFKQKMNEYLDVAQNGLDKAVSKYLPTASGSGPGGDQLERIDTTEGGGLPYIATQALANPNVGTLTGGGGGTTPGQALANSLF